MTLIQDVSDTAFMVAAYRAAETERPDALFRDPLAERLAGEHGRKIVAETPRSMRMGAWSVIIRTRIIDDFINFAVQQGVDTVLNLGAGLDTRPYRMALPASLSWIEVDYPKIIELKERQLANETPVCRLERIKLDLADRSARQAMLADVNTHAKKVLVLTEGVVPYLTNEQVALLADDLKSHATFRYWIVDYFSPETLKFRQRRAFKERMQNAPFQFHPQDYFAFFGEHGWQTTQMRYLAQESRRLGRSIPLPGLLKTWIKFASVFAPREKREAMGKFAGYALFEPQA